MRSWTTIHFSTPCHAVPSCSAPCHAALTFFSSFSFSLPSFLSGFRNSISLLPCDDHDKRDRDRERKRKKRGEKKERENCYYNNTVYLFTFNEIDSQVPVIIKMIVFSFQRPLHGVGCGMVSSSRGTSHCVRVDAFSSRGESSCNSRESGDMGESWTVSKLVSRQILTLGMGAALLCGSGPGWAFAEKEGLRSVDVGNRIGHVTAKPMMNSIIWSAPMLSDGPNEAFEIAESVAESGGRVTVSDETPIIDLARTIPPSRLEGLQQQFKQLESKTGWKLRLLSFYSDDSRAPTSDETRKGWNVDDKTVVILVIPDNPNVFNFRYGSDVQHFLSRPFFTELQARYGNYFFVRDEGVEKAVDLSVGILVGCLQSSDGCRVVPGVSSEHYLATLGSAIAGGLILGAVLRLEPQGFVQRRWIWGIIFSPLWATLTINFGLGPIMSRTSDPLPVTANIAAAALAAAAVYFYPRIAEASGLTVDYSDNE